MQTQNPQLAPDFEERYTLAYELMQHLGLDPAQVETDTLAIVLATDGDHRVTWSAHARITTEQLARITNLADAKADAR